MSSVSPANNATGVGTNSSISATFSEAMAIPALASAPFSLAPTAGGAALTGTLSISGNTATFTPSSSLAASTQYTATITTAVQDLAGNALAAPFIWSFTTGAGPDTTPPTVSATNPANNAANVLLNSSVSATFSEAMTNATLNTASITVVSTLGGPAVAGTVSVSGNTATFTPSASLAASTQYIATITTAATDAAGIVLAAPYTWSFTTGAAPDTTPPIVSFTSPANGATGVGLNSSVSSATFSEPMTNATLTTASFSLAPTAGGPAVAGTVTVNGNTAAFTPLGNLLAGTQYTATITTAVRDAAGNFLAASYFWSFTTGAAPDTTPPTVSATSPASAATGVAQNASISATFSEPMTNASLNTASITLAPTAGGPAVAGAVSVSANTATFTPLANLSFVTQYTATITTAATDAAGIALAANFAWSFTTGAAPDTTPPTVSATNPANNAAGVAQNASISATFSEPMNNATLNTASITLEETLVGTAVTGTVTVNGNTAAFAPLANLAASTQYTATISTAATDAAGNALAAPFSWSFTTGAAPDTTPPTVVLPTSPASNATGVAQNALITATFSEPMNNATLTTASVRLAQTISGTAVAGVVSVSGNTATFTPSAPLALGTQFTATITTAATDAAGNALAAPFTWSFTTLGDTAPPTVLSTSLAPGATNVSVNSGFSATFSEPMNNATLVAANFTLVETVGGAPVAGTVSVSANSVTFTPSAALALGTQYTATITTGMTDAASNALQANSTVTFTTSAGAVAACPTTPTNGTAVGGITPNLGVRRASGVGPLAVFFDATGTTVAPPSPATRPFHELEYRWDFGDPVAGAAGLWSFGSRANVSSRNAATGPVAAHVFETPGTYTVTLSAFDGTNTATPATFSCEITVTDPDVVFAGSTLCVAATGTDFTGCPIACPSANCITNGDFDNVINTVAVNGQNFKRVLFKRGQSFPSSTTANISADGPGYVGAFGTGAKPIISGATNKLSLGSNTNHDFADWRFVDLDFNGLTQTGTGVSPSGGGSKFLFLRNVFRNLDLGFNLAASQLDAINTSSTLAPMWEEWAIVDNVLSTNNSYGFLGFLNRAMFLGNQVTGQVTQHGIRIAFTQKAVISNNEMTGTPSGTALTVRATNMTPALRPGTPNGFTLPANSFTEQVVISDNKLIAGLTGFPFTVKSVNSDEDARLRNVIVERNWLISGTTGNIFFESEASELTIRNNLFDLNLLPGTARAIGLIKSTGTPAPAANIGIFNNSVFTGTASASNPFIIVDIIPGSAPTGLVIRNNLGYAPNNTATGTTAVRNLSTGTVTESNNSTAAQIKGTNPNFAVTPPTQPSHWLNSGYPRDGGLTFPAGPPVFSDFFRTARPVGAAIDIGATEQ